LVSGRWSGVRGRRFVRPTLTMTLKSDGSQLRALADLEGKPWAAEDGELWLAAFPVEVELKDARDIELSVAPDIAIQLGDVGKTSSSRPGRPLAAPDAREPVVRSEPERTRTRMRPGPDPDQLERLKARVASAEEATENERVKRKAADGIAEAERTQSRRLKSELEQLRIELELAGATRVELSSASSQLDQMRADANDHRSQLEATTRALEEERTKSGRLRQQLQDAEAALEHLRNRPEAGPPVLRSLAPPDPSTHPRTERPLNPSLRSRPNWFGRLLAVLVFIGVIVAVYYAIHTTVA
jgi:hypothetical protein